MPGPVKLQTNFSLYDFHIRSLQGNTTMEGNCKEEGELSDDENDDVIVTYASSIIVPGETKNKEEVIVIDDDDEVAKSPRTLVGSPSVRSKPLSALNTQNENIKDSSAAQTWKHKLVSPKKKRKKSGDSKYRTRRRNDGETPVSKRFDGKKFLHYGEKKKSDSHKKTESLPVQSGFLDKMRGKFKSGFQGSGTLRDLLKSRPNFEEKDALDSEKSGISCAAKDSNSQVVKEAENSSVTSESTNRNLTRFCILSIIL